MTTGTISPLQAIDELRAAVTRFESLSARLDLIWPDATAFRDRIDAVERQALRADTRVATRVALRHLVAIGRDLETAFRSAAG